MSDLWARCRAWLAPALAVGGDTEAELLAALAADQAQLWAGEAGALVTELVWEADGPCLHIWLGGGDLAGLLALRPGLEAYARGRGCRSVTIDGRRGWSRVLRRCGYAPVGNELKRIL